MFYRKKINNLDYFYVFNFSVSRSVRRKIMFFIRTIFRRGNVTFYNYYFYYIRFSRVFTRRRNNGNPSTQFDRVDTHKDFVLRNIITVSIV